MFVSKVTDVLTNDVLIQFVGQKYCHPRLFNRPHFLSRRGHDGDAIMSVATADKTNVANLTAVPFSRQSFSVKQLIIRHGGPASGLQLSE